VGSAWPIDPAPDLYIVSSPLVLFCLVSSPVSPLISSPPLSGLNGKIFRSLRRCRACSRCPQTENSWEEGARGGKSIEPHGYFGMGRERDWDLETGSASAGRSVIFLGIRERLKGQSRSPCFVACLVCLEVTNIDNQTLIKETGTSRL